MKRTRAGVVLCSPFQLCSCCVFSTTTSVNIYNGIGFVREARLPKY